MLRALVLLLVLANLAFWAWTQGWLGTPPRAGEREPQRLEAQVRPESVRVLPTAAAAAAVQAARAAALVCLETGPLKDEQLAGAEALLAGAVPGDAAWMKVDLAPANAWLVFAGRYPDAPQRKTREDELKRLKLRYELIDSPAALAPGFVLARLTTREAAEGWIKSAPEGLRGARVVQLPPPVDRWTLRVPRADSALAEQLKALSAEGLTGGFRPCGSKP